MLAFRVAAPGPLVDLRKLQGLGHISIGEEGVRLGAKVRWRDIERDARLQSAQPLLVAAVSHVAHYQIRNRGTVGGSPAHADPAAEMPSIAVTCEAEIHVRGASGPRVIRAADFVLAPLTTALAPDELIVELAPAALAGRAALDLRGVFPAARRFRPGQEEILIGADRRRKPSPRIDPARYVWLRP